MNIDEVKKYFEIGESFFKTIGIIIGGIWVYIKYIRQRENYALIDFTVDIEFHVQKNDYWIVELIAYIENKGKVQHKVRDFHFKLESLRTHDKVGLNEEYRNQVNFPKIEAENSFLPENFSYFFVEPGLKNKYSYITRIPVSAEVVLLHSWFNYIDNERKHIAEVTKKVPQVES